MAIDQHPVPTRQLPYRDQHPSGPLPAPDVPAAPMSGFAVSSLVWSLVGLITFGLGALGGVICGHLALRETGDGAHRGHRLAVAGLIIGWTQIVVGLLLGVIMLFATLFSAAGM